METSPYVQAITAARGELREIGAQLTVLRRRKERLEAMIASLSPLLIPDVAPSEAPLELTGGSRTPPLWVVIRDLMRECNSFTMTEAGEAYERATQNPLGPNRPQIVRNSLIRHLETFERLPTGDWRVRRDGWFEHEKEVSEETPIST